MRLVRIPDVGAWEPWTPQEVVTRLGACSTPWGIAGGWAVDLWLERSTRAHNDIEIAIPAQGLSAVRECLSDYLLFEAKDGALAPLEEVASDQVRQIWVLDPAAERWRVDVMLDPGDHNLWVYRRDGRVCAPRSAILAYTASGVPYVRPEVILLFKAKKPRHKDESDLAACLEKFQHSESEWLRQALVTAHPTSPWLDILSPNRAL